MKGTTIVRLALVIAALAGAAIYTPAAEAQVRPANRSERWEFFLPVIFTDSTTIKGQNGSSAELDADLGFGFGFGYNFTDHFQMNGIFSWSSRDYNATIVQTDGIIRRYSNFTESTTLSLDGVYYLLDKSITPFVSGGIGLTYIDTNIQNGVATSSCWYDPWWGYVCSSYVPTKTEYDVSYNAGVGVRFDFTRDFALQASYNKMWIDMNKASGIPGLDVWKVDFILRM